MSNEPIVMHFMENGPIERFLTLAYNIEFTSGWTRGLQRLCFWLMNKTGCIHPHFDEKQLVRSVYIDRDKAVKDIVAMASAQLKNVGYRPTKILLGHKELNKLLDTELPYFGTPIAFNLQIPLYEPNMDSRTGEYKTHFTLFNLKVEVIPWMDGILVI